MNHKEAILKATLQLPKKSYVIPLIYPIPDAVMFSEGKIIALEVEKDLLGKSIIPLLKKVNDYVSVKRYDIVVYKDLESNFFEVFSGKCSLPLEEDEIEMVSKLFRINKDEIMNVGLDEFMMDKFLINRKPKIRSTFLPQKPSVQLEMPVIKKDEYEERIEEYRKRKKDGTWSIF